MPELKEFFDMVTKQIEPDLDSWNHRNSGIDVQPETGSWAPSHSLLRSRSSWWW